MTIDVTINNIETLETVKKLVYSSEDFTIENIEKLFLYAVKQHELNDFNFWDYDKNVIHKSSIRKSRLNKNVFYYENKNYLYMAKFNKK